LKYIKTTRYTLVTPRYTLGLPVTLF
jgi:hypothetical protein